MDEWSLAYYRAQTGRSPVKDYIAGLDERQRARVTFDLDRLKAFGLNLGAPYVRNLGGKIWELRTTGSIQHRILYFAASGRRLVLLHAFAKKTQKTPASELEIAIRRMNDYLERMKL